MPPAPPARAAASSDQWITLPDGAGRLYARQWQAGGDDAGRAPIVMQHDSLGCVALWRDFPERLCLATGRRVVAYDRLGFGQSDARTDRVSFDFIAEEATRALPAVRMQLGIDRFVALGHSVGGGMSIETAAQLPADCEALVTLSAQSFAEARTLAGVRDARGRFEDPAQVERLARHHGDKARWVLSAWVDTWLDPHFADWSLADVLPRVRCPALAIHGEADEYGSPAHARLIGERTGGPCTVRLLPGVGHVPQRERPDEVVAMIAAFLASQAC